MASYSSLHAYLNSTVPGVWSIRFRSWLPAIPLIGSWLSSYFPPVEQKLIKIRMSLDAGNDDYILIHTGTSEQIEKIELFDEHEQTILRNDKIKRYALLEKFEDLSVLCGTDVQLEDLQKDIQFLLALKGSPRGKQFYHRAAAYLAVYPLFIHEIKNLSFEDQDYAELFNTNFHDYRHEKIKDLTTQGNVYEIQNFCDEKTSVDDIKLFLAEGAKCQDTNSSSVYYKAAAYLAVHFYQPVIINQITQAPNDHLDASLAMSWVKQFKHEKIKELAESSSCNKLPFLSLENDCRQDILFLLTIAKEEQKANLQQQYYQAAQYLANYYALSPQADDHKMLSDFLRHISIKNELAKGRAIDDLCTPETCYDDIRFLTKETQYEAAYSLINRFKLILEELKGKTFNDCQSNEDKLLYDKLSEYCRDSKFRELVLEDNLEDKLEEIVTLFTQDSCYEGIRYLLTLAAETTTTSLQKRKYHQIALHLFETFELKLENLAEKFNLDPTQQEAKFFHAFLTTCANKLKVDCIQSFHTFKSQSFVARKEYTENSVNYHSLQIRNAYLLNDSSPFTKLQRWVNGYDEKKEAALAPLRAVLSRIGIFIKFIASNVQVRDFLGSEIMRIEREQQHARNQEEFKQNLRDGTLQVVAYSDLEELFPDEEERRHTIEQCRELAVDITRPSSGLGI